MVRINCSSFMYIWRLFSVFFSVVVWVFLLFDVELYGFFIEDDALFGVLCVFVCLFECWFLWV